MTHLELINEYYDLSGEKVLKVLKAVGGNNYCVSIVDQEGYKFSTLVEIHTSGDSEYAIERDHCCPGAEEEMISYYLGDSEEEDGDDDGDDVDIDDLLEELGE